MDATSTVRRDRRELVLSPAKSARSHMRAVYLGYVLLGLGGPLLVAGMLLFGMVFVPRRGPPMAVLTLRHPHSLQPRLWGLSDFA
jgi:hypothetical protein